MPRVTTETRLAEQQKDICYMKKAIDEVKDEVKTIHERIDVFVEAADQKYAAQKDFDFWRNVLISGILVTIFVAILMNLIIR